MIFALTLLAACGSNEAADRDAVHVAGRLIDGESGKPVTRAGIWVHAFRDEIKAQSTAEPDANRSDFELTLPGPAASVRVRVADSTNAHELFEQTFAVTGNALDVDVKLVPTHWLRLHGRIQWRDGDRLRPASEGDDVFGHGLFLWRAGAPGVDVPQRDEYSVLVPRELLRPAALCTEHRLAPVEIDLRGATEAERRVDLVFEKR
jgi:hypothetical protein